MTSKIKVDNINKVSDDSNIIKKCGTTTTIGSGASNPIVVDGSAITLGRCGGTVALASGATQSGFGRSGSVNWQTTPKTATFTAADGEGYFINSGSAITMNLPAGSAGAIVAVSDYARNFATYNLTISSNGSEKIGGVTEDATLDIDGQAATFVYVDSTKGWINVQNAEDTETGNPPFLVATGGTETTCGDYKIHTFTGGGPFNVTSLSPTPSNNVVDYLVVAGGGSGGARYPGNANGGGGAGGFRFHSCQTAFPTSSAPAHNKNGPAALPVSVQDYTIVVGGGGAAVGPSPGGIIGNSGTVSTFSTITSAGGGYGGAGAGGKETAGNGGSGGGAGGGQPGGSPVSSGNTPPTTPAQGSNGGQGGGTSPDAGSGGGGGAMAVGSNANQQPGNGLGGAGGGLPTGFGANGVPCGSFRYYAGGGGAGAHPDFPAGAGGIGGGGTCSTNGTANSGGGGGGSNAGSNSVSGAGGSGIVVIRYKFQ